MKLISAAFAALVLAFSMMLVPSTATAAPSAYPGSVSTFCSFSVPHVSGHHHLTVRMRVRAGNAVPVGHVAPRLYKRVAPHRFKLVRHAWRLYSGGVQKFNFRHLGRGRYHVQYRYVPRKNSVFKSCSSSVRSVWVH